MHNRFLLTNLEFWKCVIGGLTKQLFLMGVTSHKNPFIRKQPSKVTFLHHLQHSRYSLSPHFTFCFFLSISLQDGQTSKKTHVAIVNSEASLKIKTILSWGFAACQLTILFYLIMPSNLGWKENQSFQQGCLWAYCYA